MDFEGIYASAESACSNLKDRDYTKIFVASLIGDTNARGVLEKFQAETEKKGLKAMVIRTGSLGYYDLEPLVMIEKPGLPPRTYYNMTPDGASGLVEDYLRKDNPGTDLALTGEPAGPLFEAETRIALRNCGHIDPENIHHYVYLRKGYSGLSKALTMSKEEVIAEVEKSGLRGRGGGGFHTADKWRACREAEGKEKIMVCDAMDADPRSKTARLLLESDPHGVLEGMLIAAYAVGASRCMICLNREYHNAIQGLAKAIDQLKEYGLIGDHILESTFHCEIEIREAEAFLVMGEETALISVLEEKQAMPYVRPPFPAVKGFKNRPTLINNLETLANVSAVFQQGPGCLSGSGKDRDNGTKVITLSGDVVHPYTVEVTFGTTVRHIIEKIGAGVTHGKKLKGVQWGGPTGVYLAANFLDIPVAYESMEKAGVLIGSGTIEVLSEDSCAVETCRDILAYIHSQSCGKCVFCREGTYQMSDILAGISEQSGKPQDLELLIEMGEAMKTGCICGLGSRAPDPVMSSIRLFRDEFDFHIKEKRCPVDSQG